TQPDLPTASAALQMHQSLLLTLPWPACSVWCTCTLPSLLGLGHRDVSSLVDSWLELLQAESTIFLTFWQEGITIISTLLTWLCYNTLTVEFDTENPPQATPL